MCIGINLSLDSIKYNDEVVISVNPIHNSHPYLNNCLLFLSQANQTFDNPTLESDDGPSGGPTCGGPPDVAAKGQQAVEDKPIKVISGETMTDRQPGMNTDKEIKYPSWYIIQIKTGSM